jgi:glycosyltransferase involved in cell wall biosynthesis
MAIQVCEIELNDKFDAVPVNPNYNKCRILVRYVKVPLGWVQLSCRNKTFIAADELRKAVRKQLEWPVVKTFLKNDIGTRSLQEEFRPISVVVCTRNRPHFLIHCLQALLQLSYTNFEIIIVDNAPANDETKEVVSPLPVRYVREDRPGLNWARNRGIKEASHEIVAFTDDDARVDTFWLHAINQAFSNESVMAVSGMVAPAEMETPAQRMFELGYGGMGHGFSKRYISQKQLSNRQLLWASSFGIGANMAFRKTVFSKTGLFDVAFDVGTPTRGGGDVEMFFRLVRQGFVMVYDPAVLIWHVHRKSMASLYNQIQDNGKSTGCFLIHVFRHNLVKRSQVIQFLLVDWLWQWNLKNLVRKNKHISRRASLYELRGLLSSPYAYWSSQKLAKRTLSDLENSN